MPGEYHTIIDLSRLFSKKKIFFILYLFHLCKFIEEGVNEFTAKGVYLSMLRKDAIPFPQSPIPPGCERSEPESGMFYQ